MPLYTNRFRVNAPPEAVSLFHRSPNALGKLTPPPVILRVQRADPLTEGAQAEFTLWFGPLPVRWTALHFDVDFEQGFTDQQVRGPFKSWTHQRRWLPLPESATMIEERITYTHHPGWRGLLTRLLFARPMLHIMFAYRKWVLRRSLENARGR
jgi:ligand-binding SRPBCC domain-containing protein